MFSFCSSSRSVGPLGLHGCRLRFLDALLSYIGRSPRLALRPLLVFCSPLFLRPRCSSSCTLPCMKSVRVCHTSGVHNPLSYWMLCACIFPLFSSASLCCGVSGRLATLGSRCGCIGWTSAGLGCSRGLVFCPDPDAPPVKLPCPRSCCCCWSLSCCCILSHSRRGSPLPVPFPLASLTVLCLNSSGMRLSRPYSSK